MTLADKLHPSNFTAMSGKMAAIVGYIINEEWTRPSINDMAITSDGFVMAQISGDIGMNEFIGEASDLRRNWNTLLDAAGLTDEERQEARTLYKEKFGD